MRSVWSREGHLKHKCNQWIFKYLTFSTLFKRVDRWVSQYLTFYTQPEQILFDSEKPQLRQMHISHQTYFFWWHRCSWMVDSGQWPNFSWWLCSKWQIKVSVDLLNASFAWKSLHSTSFSSILYKLYTKHFDGCSCLVVFEYFSCLYR